MLALQRTGKMQSPDSKLLRPKDGLCITWEFAMNPSLQNAFPQTLAGLKAWRSMDCMEFSKDLGSSGRRGCTDPA